jgi:hypothetical protein
MFARGWACLHTAQLPVPKHSAAKPYISITSKLIESKRLQVLYFGHLRKTGERGSYRLVHTAYLHLRKPHGSKFNHSRTYESLSRKSNYSRTYATPRGWGVFPGLTFKFHLKCRRADIFPLPEEPGDERVGQPRREKREESFVPVEITGVWVRAEKGIGGRIVLGVVCAGADPPVHPGSAPGWDGGANPAKSRPPDGV